MKIIRLEADNVKKLRAVEITPDGPMVVIKGRNGAGKSSVLDSIAMALGGKDLQPPEVIRRGETNAHVTVDLGELVVSRTWTEKGTYLEVKSKDGAKYGSPQAMLDKLVGALSFDPISFMRLPNKEQVDTLRALVGLDFTAMDKERQASFDHRTTVNRELKQLEARLATMPKPEGKVDPVSLDDLLAEQELMMGIQKDNDSTRSELSRAESEERRARELLAVARGEVDHLEAKLVKARAAMKEGEETLEGRRMKTILLGASVKGLVEPDLESIRERIRTANATNDKVRRATERQEVQSQLRAKEAAVAALTQAIANIDESKALMLAEAKFPVAGLSFVENGLTLNGLPLEQASSAEQLRVSLAMGLALNPKLKVLLIRDGSLLDADSLRMVGEMAAIADAQVWLERVGNEDAVGILIEDGEAVAS